jgi:pre-mRNA cleavage complex 2 protein Pcf11
MADNAADVAEDYRQALEDLTVNSRIEIATLTNIARENANHGFAIAEALANHIKKVCLIVSVLGQPAPVNMPSRIARLT